MELLKVGGKGKKKITNTLGIGKEKYKVEVKFTLKGVQNLSTEAGVGVFVTWKRGKRNGTSKTAFTSNNKSISLNDNFSFPASFLCDTSTKKFEPKALKIQLNETKNKKTFAKLEINVTDYIEYALGKDIQLAFQSKGSPPSLQLYWQTTILKIGNKKIEKVEKVSSSPSTLSPSLSAPSSGMTNLLPSQSPRTPSQLDRVVPTLFGEGAGRSRVSRVFGGLEFVLGDTDEASSDPTYSKSDVDDDDDDDLFSDIINSDSFNNDNINNNNNNLLSNSKELSEDLGSQLTSSTDESVSIPVVEGKESNSVLSQSNDNNNNNGGHHEKKSDRKSSSAGENNNKDSSDKPHRKEKNHSKEKEKEKELTREPKDREKVKEKGDKEPKDNKEKEGKEGRERKEKEVKEKDHSKDKEKEVEISASKEEIILTASQEKSHKKEKNHSKDKEKELREPKEKEKEKELRESKETREPKDREKVKERGDKEKEKEKELRDSKEKELRESKEVKEKGEKEHKEKELRESHKEKGEKEHKVKEKSDKELRESKEKKVKGDENASNNELKFDQTENNNEKSEQKLRRETFDPSLMKEFRKVDKSPSGGSSSNRRETTDLSSILPSISVTKVDKVENNRDSGSGISMKNITSNINSLGNNITSNINTLGSNITSNINNILNPISPRKPKKENKDKIKKNNGEEEEIKELNKHTSDLLLPVQSQISDSTITKSESSRNRSPNRNSSDPVVKKNSLTHSSDLPVIHIEKERKEKKEKEEKKEGGIAKKKELSVSFQFEDGKKEKREKSEENVHPFKSYGIDAVNQLKQLQIQHAELQQKYQNKKKKLSELKKGNLSQLPNVPSISLSSSSNTLSEGDEEEDEDQQLMVLHTQRLTEYMAKVFLFLLSLLLLANIF